MANPVRIPDDTRSIHNIGAFIMSYQPYQNAFVNALVNRIGMVIITSKLWQNPWSVFKRGYMEFGETVEEIFVNIANPHSYDPSTAESQIFRRELPDVRAAFHAMNFQKFYKTTVSNDQLRQAFLSWGGITDLIAKIVDALYTGMQQDEYTVMKYMVCREAISGRMAVETVPALSATNGIQDNAKALRAMSSNLTFNKTEYNQASVYNHTNREDQYIIVDTVFEATMDVDVLAVAFHMEKADFLGHLIIVDSFSEHDTDRLALLFENDSTYVPFTSGDIANLEDIHALVVDKDWWMVFDNFQNMTQNYNGEGLYWNYWLHVWKTFSVSPFANAVVFAESSGSITTVAVSPASATVLPGTMAQFSATVTASGIIDQGVVWSIVGDDNGTPDPDVTFKSGTKIDPYSGILTVDSTETETVIYVVATSKANSAKSGSATVSTVSN